MNCEKSLEYGRGENRNILEQFRALSRTFSGRCRRVQHLYTSIQILMQEIHCHRYAER